MNAKNNYGKAILDLDLPLLPNEHVVYTAEAKHMLKTKYVIVTNRRLLIYTKGRKAVYTSIFYSKISQVNLLSGIYSVLVITLSGDNAEEKKIAFDNAVACKSVFTVISYHAALNGSMQANAFAEESSAERLSNAAYAKYSQAQPANAVEISEKEESSFVEMLMQEDKNAAELRMQKAIPNAISMKIKAFQRKDDSYIQHRQISSSPNEEHRLGLSTSAGTIASVDAVKPDIAMATEEAKATEFSKKEPISEVNKVEHAELAFLRNGKGTYQLNAVAANNTVPIDDAISRQKRMFSAINNNTVGEPIIARILSAQAKIRAEESSTKAEISHFIAPKVEHALSKENLENELLIFKIRKAKQRHSTSAGKARE